MNRILKVIIFVIFILFLLTVESQALSATVSTNVSKVKVGEEVKLTITFDEMIVATNFDINYDEKFFEFVKGDNINAAERNGKIACIYADSTLVGTNSLSLTFKAIVEGNDLAFSVENAKIRVKDQENSTNGSLVNGLSAIETVEIIEEDLPKEDGTEEQEEYFNKQEENVIQKKETTVTTTTTTNNETQTKQVIPKAGNDFDYKIFVAIAIIAAFCIASKIRFNSMKKMFILIPVLFIGSVFFINSSTFAANEDITIKECSNLIKDKKVFAIMLPKDTKNLYITAIELENLIKEKFNYKVTGISNDDETTLGSSNKVNTGAQITINEEKYTALVYGDANGDGIICDIDDLIVIIKDFLRIKRVSGEYKLAADLANKDNLNILDIDDLIQMISMYLGRLNGDLVQVLPTEKELILNIADTNNITLGGGYCWKYRVYADGTVVGEKWTSGSVLNFVSEKIKEYTITLTSKEVEFLKDIENRYVKGIIPENIIAGIIVENKNGKDIRTTTLTISDFNILKSIIEKIIEFREEIILYYNDTYNLSGNSQNSTYNIDIYSKNIIYNKKSSDLYMNQTSGIDYVKQTQKSLTEEQITNIKELYRKIKNNSNKYEISSTDRSIIKEDHYYTIDSYYIIWQEEDIKTIDLIVSNMDNIEGTEAKINNNISNICTTSLEMDDGTKKTIKLEEKGYGFIEEGNYYLIITAGEKSNVNCYLTVSDINIESDNIYIYITENETRYESTLQKISYPYSIIKFKKKPQQNIILKMENGELYRKLDLLLTDYSEPVIFKKPVIYIYPKKETKVSVKVGNPENLICTYPKYVDGWNVIAKPNGDLTDCSTGRNLYCLYWEGKSILKPNLTEGFIVKGEDTSKFLEEKLEILGLNEKETNEFIIYWLPQLESNKYNFIRFQTTEEINRNMPLEINPTPDTTIRIMMEWKALENPINIKEQKLERMERNGFSVVEWGGTEVK